LNHPAMGVAWLANKLHAHGETLKAGEIILAGSFTKPMWVHPGDTVHADYGELGAITCRFQQNFQILLPSASPTRKALKSGCLLPLVQKPTRRLSPRQALIGYSLMLSTPLMV